MNPKLKEKLSQIGTSNICPIALILRDNKILMGKRNDSSEFSVWTLPGGRCKKDETVEMTLRREVNEEVGIFDLIIKDFIGEIPGYKEDDIVPIFLCSSIQEAKLIEPEKFDCWQWFSFEDYKKGIENAHSSVSRKLVVDYLETTDLIIQNS